VRGSRTAVSPVHPDCNGVTASCKRTELLLNENLLKRTSFSVSLNPQLANVHLRRIQTPVTPLECPSLAGRTDSIGLFYAQGPKTPCPSKL